MRGRLPNLGAIGRVVGLAAVAAALVATAMHLRHDDARQHTPPSTPSMESAPLARELAACQAIGMAAKDNEACEAAWAENRRRFFTYRPPTQTPPAVARPSSNPTEGR